MTDIIAVLPLGAHEYHGAHLPFETDSLIIQAFAAEIKTRLPPAMQAHFLPVQSVTYSREHMRAEGTKTLTAAAAIGKWIKIAERQHKKGIRKLIMLNAHGGNSPLMTIVATELRARFNMLAVSANFGRFSLPHGLLTAEEKMLDIHGGFIETSVMLAIAPHKVTLAEARNFDNTQRHYMEKFTYLRAYGQFSFGWLMQDINPQGAAGNAARANAEAGKKILAHRAAEAVKLFADTEKFAIDTFR